MVYQYNCDCGWISDGFAYIDTLKADNDSRCLQCKNEMDESKIKEIKVLESFPYMIETIAEIIAKNKNKEFKNNSIDILKDEFTLIEHFDDYKDIDFLYDKISDNYWLRIIKDKENVKEEFKSFCDMFEYCTKNYLYYETFYTEHEDIMLLKKDFESEVLYQFMNHLHNELNGIET